jgi:patatin-like phospholipase/acyl hydrolase
MMPSDSITSHFRILALSGGGYRGLFTATILEGLEKEARRPLAQCFDLICGTSIGGIVALALAHEVPMTDLVSLFETRGDDIFSKRLNKQLWRALTGRSLYDGKALQAAVRDLFQDATVGDLRHRVIIPAINYTKGEGQMFKTPHHPTFKTDWQYRIADVALATSAAPIFLPLYSFNRWRFIDGGLYGNAPSMFGVHEAESFLDQDIKNVYVLAVGTAASRPSDDIKKRGDWGPQKFREVIEVSMAAQEGSVGRIMQHRLKQRLFTIDRNLTDHQARNVGLDLTDKAARETLTGAALIALQEAVGKPELNGFMTHQPEPAKFYYGPNKNTEL